MIKLILFFKKKYYLRYKPVLSAIRPAGMESWRAGVESPSHPYHAWYLSWLLGYTSRSHVHSVSYGNVRVNISYKSGKGNCVHVLYLLSFTASSLVI